MEESKKFYGQALFDFEPSYADELKVTAGDVVQILYELNQDWVYAKSLMANSTDSQTGILPKNFVSLVNIPDYLIDRRLNERLFLAIDQFDVSESGDLAFKKNDIIISQNQVDENWHFGYCINDLSRTGIFPLTHVMEICLQSAENSHLNSPVANTQETFLSVKKSILRQAIALHSTVDDLVSSGEGYLRFNKGDYILVTGELEDPNWLQGENLHGERAIFQAQYVQYISSDDSGAEPAILNRTQRRATMSAADDKIPNPVSHVYHDSNDLQEPNMSPSTIDSGTSTSLPHVYQNQPIDLPEPIVVPPPLPEKTYLRKEYTEETIPPPLPEKTYLKSLSTTSMTTSEINNNSLPFDAAKTSGFKADFASSSLQSSDEPALGVSDTNESDLTFFSQPTRTMSTDKFYRVNFDFKAEHPHELDCLCGDYLKLVQVVDESTNEWIIAENKHGKRGLVQSDYLTLLIKDYPEVIEQFNKAPKPLKPPPLPKYSPKTAAENEKKSEPQISMNSLKPEALKPTTSRSQSLSVLPGTSTSNIPLIIPSPRGPKPAIAPKPKLLKKVSEPPTIRPAVLNNKLSANIKSLETIIQKQFEERKSSIVSPSSTKSMTVKEPSIYAAPTDADNESIKLESMQHDLTSIKTPSLGDDQLLIDLKSFDTGSDTSPTVVDKEPQSRVDEVDSEEKNRKKREIERKYSIKELYETEKDFCKELSLLHDIFVNDTNAPWDFDKNALFEELKLVVVFSTSLIYSLETELASNNDAEIKIGICLTESSEDMKLVYAKYLQNHSNIAALIKSYEAIPRFNEYISSRLKLLESAKFPTLSALMIKPVQRIFKYPLFLKRIFDNTDRDHCDYENLKQAIDIFTKMLDFINEYKRRKDLVHKYLSTEEKSIGDMMKTLTMKNIKKKTTRFSVQFSNKLGIYNQQVVDESYYKVEADFKLVAKEIQKYFEGLNTYLSCLRNHYESEETYFSAIPRMFEEEDSKDRERFMSLIRHCEYHKTKQKAYYDVLKSTSLVPLDTLLGYLRNPFKLIEKRNDKLVDYEAILSDVKLKSMQGPVSKELDTNLDLARKDYEALNDQLIEELPQLTQKSVRVLNMCFMAFSSLTTKYFKGVKANLCKHFEKLPVTDKPLDLNLYSSQLESSFQRKHSLAALESYTYNIDRSQIIPYQTEAHRDILKQKFELSDLYIVARDYVPNEKLCQLSQNVNDLVGVLKRYDPSNQTHIWMVHNGESQGFIPSAVLEPYKPAQTACTDLIDFEKEEDTLETKRNSLNVPLRPVVEEYCIAVFDFEALSDNMMDLIDGDIYQVLEKQDKKGNPDWWLVESNKNIGYVPRTYLKLLD